MGKLTRTVLGRLEAFNPQSELSHELRLLLKFIDGKRNQQDLQKLHSVGHYAHSNLQQLMALGLVQEESDSLSHETIHAQDDVAYMPTIPASLTPYGQTKTLLTLVIDQRSKNIFQRRVALLAQCKSDMETFLLVHAPRVALTLLSDIESITTLDQLEASLSTYEEMITATGRLGWTHVTQIRELLARDTQSA